MQIHFLLTKTVVFKQQKIAQVNLAIFCCLNPFSGFALGVESGRVELPSKQATKELSTRLFSEWIFVNRLGQKQPPIS
jgi:hypothetical protein